MTPVSLRDEGSLITFPYDLKFIWALTSFWYSYGHLRPSGICAGGYDDVNGTVTYLADQLARIWRSLAILPKLSVVPTEDSALVSRVPIRFVTGCADTTFSWVPPHRVREGERSRDPVHHRLDLFLT